MKIRYLIQKEQRKAMAQTIADLTGTPAEYLAAPTFAYQISAFLLDKNAVLSFDDSIDENFMDMVLSGLEKAGYPAEETPELLTVSMPKNFFDGTALENLKCIVVNKEHLLKHAFDTDSLEITETDETIKFSWFSLHDDSDSDAYCKFISALCDFAKNQKRVNNKPDTSDNEKYAFRRFLLLVGMIGSEYKSTRKVLLRNLTGSIAFCHGKPKGESGHEVSE